MKQKKIKPTKLFLEIDTTPDLLEGIAKSFLEAKESQKSVGPFYVAMPTIHEDLHIRFKWQCPKTSKVQ